MTSLCAKPGLGRAEMLEINLQLHAQSVLAAFRMFTLLCLQTTDQNG